MEITEEEVFNDWRNYGFTPEVVVRMRRPRDRAPKPLVLVKVPREQKNIYHLREVLSLEITVEALKPNHSIGQCYRCQRFGHAQSRCTAPRKCVTCAGDHEPGTCTRPKQIPATCANCGEDHPANYRGCARFPKTNPRPLKISGEQGDDGRSCPRAMTSSLRDRA
ncbi:zinc finger associated protein [Popillia japonica]|uniref:Zinc finger associated protein n=1 Tax=Popillia japonica TaxID=7064 RepID=A0AAW1IB98_POPJA